MSNRFLDGARRRKRSPLGHSIGGVGPRRHLVERLTLAEDRRHIRYGFTVEDPDYYPVPFHFSMLWTHRSDPALQETKCDDRTAHKYLSVEWANSSKMRSRWTREQSAAVWRWSARWACSAKGGSR